MARILVAENNAAVSAYLRAELKKSGHRVETAAHSLDAWRAISKGGFDALLVNAVMPGIDGFILAQKALQENPAAHIIFVTGFAAVAMDTIATPSYAPAPFTSRPFHLKQLRRRLDALMNGGFHDGAAQQTPGTVVYADFARKPAQEREAQA